MNQPTPDVILEDAPVFVGRWQQQRLRRARCTVCDWTSSPGRASQVVPAWIRHARLHREAGEAMPQSP